LKRRRYDMKTGYDPNQSRDENGEWVVENAARTAAGVVRKPFTKKQAVQWVAQGCPGGRLEVDDYEIGHTTLVVNRIEENSKYFHGGKAIYWALVNRASPSEMDTYMNSEKSFVQYLVDSKATEHHLSKA
jgi:hypothetical protein